MGKNVTLVFFYDDNTDDEDSSHLLAGLEWQVRNLMQEWEIEETPVPPHLTQRILSLF
ncbi:MAG: hypothetical protein WHT29_07400 [Bacteroidales bacterium]|nr:hypothetical protein [Bacteroidales bacterium]HOK99485.1 hypothetical protein [Bacteroidales bacterium]HPO66351.1 hypothetical protein [Bacteroidales bacterium]